MICDKCSDMIEKNEERNHKSEILCEDCYLDILTPVKSCEPWAEYNARAFSGDSVESLTDIQKEIINVLKKNSNSETRTIHEKMRTEIPYSEFERNFSTLKNMGKFKGEKRDGVLYLSLK